ncbi:MAG: redoxin domain-containing protein [Gammaproteobacteria bacterium]|nr:redoxin domain-containing protein [Gammaproteobacteria bacterium]
MLRDWQRQLLVVNFWAPWCAPCRREIPALIQVQEEYRSRGVAILGIAFDNEPQVRRFADEYNINYPLFLSSNRAAMYNAALGNPSGSLPFTALLDRELRIIYRHNGELTLDELRAQLEQHL